MTPNSFQFSTGNGTWNSFDDWGIGVKKSDLFAPEKRDNSRQVPKLSGVYRAAGEYYNERILRLECVWVRRMTRFRVRQIAGILKKAGQIQLWDEAQDEQGADGNDNRRALHYLGEMFYAPELTMYAGETPRGFDIEFLCYPFALSDTISTPLASGVNKIDYRGTVETPCMIVLDNVGDAPISNITITTIKKEI